MHAQLQTLFSPRLQLTHAINKQIQYFKSVFTSKPLQRAKYSIQGRKEKITGLKGFGEFTVRNVALGNIDV